MARPCYAPGGRAGTAPMPHSAPRTATGHRGGTRSLRRATAGWRVVGAITCFYRTRWRQPPGRNHAAGANDPPGTTPLAPTTRAERRRWRQRPATRLPGASPDPVPGDGRLAGGWRHHLLLSHPLAPTTRAERRRWRQRPATRLPAVRPGTPAFASSLPGAGITDVPGWRDRAPAVTRLYLLGKGGCAAGTGAAASGSRRRALPEWGAEGWILGLCAPSPTSLTST